ncbi:hypothetical protein OS493_036988 [Desmophyllum pertusum]|uniref:Uncharacterized protein n=1 Tax=Desmophyllum pertusum TaxID=174260 RepID=A0A9W9YUI0_9CNID|nr:hypothetical protein OS493_036988 [Desmophyllum pertusum]
MAGKLNGIACIEKLAQKGKWGDEDAIKALQLESVVKSPSFKEMDRSTLSTCLTVGGFLATDQLKTNLKPDVDKHDVLMRMSKVCTDTMNWCRKIGEEDGGKVI